MLGTSINCESRPAERGLGVLVISRLHRSQLQALAALRANHTTLGCIRLSTASQTGEGIVPLH